MGRVITCPECGSDDLRRAGQATPGITLECERCGHRFERIPAQPCPRCGSTDVEESGYEGWEYHDPVEARDNSMAAWDYVPRHLFRCRKCRHDWGNVPR